MNIFKRTSLKSSLAGVLMLIVVGGFLMGCQPETVAPAPVTPEGYRQMGSADRRRHHDSNIIIRNLARVQNHTLTPKQRTDSLEVVQLVLDKDDSVIGDPNSLEDLSTLLNDPKCPPKLSEKVLLFLLNQNYADLVAKVIPLIPELDKNPTLQAAVLEWLSNNPVPDTLGGVVRAWAKEPTATGKNETTYRDTVQQITNRIWDVALFEALDSPDRDFTEKGAALEVLYKRMDGKKLRTKLLGLSPQSTAVKTIQCFLRNFGYLPANEVQLKNCEIIFVQRGKLIPEAARLFREWNRDYGYEFNVRDFHLLSRLGTDPLRSHLKRTQLILEIGQLLKARRHVKDPANPNKYNFWLQVDNLTMPDLWNIYLLDEMLSRPLTQKKLRLLANNDLLDTKTQYGGLVFYKGGQAEATIYPRAADAPNNDLAYFPSQRLLREGQDSLCRIIGHFDKIDRSNNVFPAAQELKQAKDGNYYVLFLTRTGKNSFCGHYASPDGVVVSLGKFRLR
ncbi:MAG: hypothetical protein KAR11_06685 [Phycisphaerae bacterium]|nr:hypothetical protein [Phycisphaerae bacterium]